MKVNGKTPRDVGPADTQPSTHVKREPTVQPCTGSEGASKWINGQYSLGQRYRGRISQIQKTLFLWWQRKNANPILKTVVDYVKHVFWEHNQQPKDREKLLSTGAIILEDEGCEMFQDRSAKDNGKSGCGVVIKGVNWYRCVTICEIAVLVGFTQIACVIDTNLDLDKQ